jgi:hypothetical protein
MSLVRIDSLFAPHKEVLGNVLLLILTVDPLEQIKLKNKNLRYFCHTNFLYCINYLWYLVWFWLWCLAMPLKNVLKYLNFCKICRYLLYTLYLYCLITYCSIKRCLIGIWSDLSYRSKVIPQKNVNINNIPL